MPNNRFDDYAKFVGYLISENDRSIYEKAALQLSPKFFLEPFIEDVVGIIYILYRGDEEVNATALSVRFFNDEDDFSQRMKHARDFFHKPETASIDDLRSSFASFIADCFTRLVSGAEFATIVHNILKTYAQNKSRELFNHYVRNIGCLEAYAEFIREIESLNALVLTEAWRTSIIDMTALSTKLIAGPLIQRGEEGLIYRGDVHMISGAPGAMKSKFATCIASAALNDCLEADHTLGMYSTISDMRVAYVDTELSDDTIRRRIPLWESLCGRKAFDSDRLTYISLRRFTKEERRRRINALIVKGGYDIVIIDGLRDLSLDFNDAREAAEMADSYKRLAENYHCAIIVTSHTSKGTDYSRGHLGSQFKDEVGLEVILRYRAVDQTVEVDFAKTRHSLPKNFTFRQLESNRLVDIENAVDNSELSRSRKTARECFNKYLIPGRRYRYMEILAILSEHGITEATAKKYIKEAKGITLRYTDKMYSLPDTDLFENEDLP